jgi:hypothetical protein
LGGTIFGVARIELSDARTESIGLHVGGHVAPLVDAGIR